MYIPEYPMPPDEFRQAIKEAREIGCWVKSGIRPKQGYCRYVITKAGSPTPLFANDDIEEIRNWIRFQAVGGRHE